MSEIYHPVLNKRRIIKATIISIVLGAILLVCAILPAEYGIDPLGAGKLFGFNRLYVPEKNAGGTQILASNSFPLIKMEEAGSGPEVKRPVEADSPPPATQLGMRQDSVQVTVPAGKGIEYKVYMLKHGQLKYEWAADKDVVYFDFHGEVNQAEKTKDVYFESYTIAYSANMVGTFLAPYEGKHGWFFRNNSKEDIVITIRLKGQYEM
jgi:hypothetical protein